MAVMGSNKPYMIRAVYDWIVDNHCTPYLVVSAEYPGTQVPEHLVREGQITLNVSPSAVKDLHLGNDMIDFKARFSGEPFELLVPVSSVSAIFAKENGQGMGFEVSLPEPPSPLDETTNRPSLKLVK